MAPYWGWFSWWFMAFGLSHISPRVLSVRKLIKLKNFMEVGRPNNWNMLATFYPPSKRNAHRSGKSTICRSPMQFHMLVCRRVASIWGSEAVSEATALCFGHPNRPRSRPSPGLIRPCSVRDAGWESLGRGHSRQSLTCFHDHAIIENPVVRS